MPVVQGVQYVNVGSGQLISSAFAVGRATRVAVSFPTITSAAAFLLGSWDQTSANFMRMVASTGSTYQFFPGPGSVSVVIDSALLPMSFGKIEFTQSQAAVRSLAIISRI